MWLEYGLQDTTSLKILQSISVDWLKETDDGEQDMWGNDQ